MHPEPNGRSRRAAFPEKRKRKKRPESLGCLVPGLGFLVTGVVLLWLYFGGAETRRGNPLMGLIGGAMFTLIGLVAVASGLAALFKKKR